MTKPLIAVLLFAFIVAACGGGDAPAPATPAPTTQAAPSTADVTGGNPTATAAAPAIVPTNPPGCSDSASFVDDVTVADNTSFPRQTAFTKTWRLKNNGTCAWNANYNLVFVNGEQMGAPASIPLTYTPSGETLDLSVDLVSPARDGAFVGNFELRNPDGGLIPVDNGRYIWVAIVVGETVVVDLAPTPASGGLPLPPPTLPANAPCDYTPNPDFVNQILALINSQRAANGLPALTLNAQLTAAAQGHAADMACNSFLSHVGSDGSSVKTRVTAAGYAFSVALENIYAQPPQYGGTPESAVQWWMSDLIHRNTILHNKVLEIGVGYAYYADSQLDGYWSVVFAAP